MEAYNKRADEKQTAIRQSNAPREETAYTIDLVELFFRLLERWKLILLFAVIGAIVSCGYTVIFLKPQYEATSVIYVLNNGDSVINMSDLQIGAALTSDYVKVFDIWEVHEQVLTELNLQYSYKQIADMLEVTNPSSTRMLYITVTSGSAQEAADIANAYADIGSRYIAENMGTTKPSIMSKALVPSSPVSPSKTKNTVIGAFLGCLLACGIVTMSYTLDDKIKSGDDITKYTGLVNLASVPINSLQRGASNK